MENDKRKEIAHKLCSIYGRIQNTDFDVKVYSMDIMHIMYDLVKINKEQFEQIEYNLASLSTNPNVMVYGFRLKDKNIRIADIINILEEIPIPTKILNQFPDMRQSEWEALMRLATMILLAFGPYTSSQHSRNINREKFARKLCSLYKYLENSVFDVSVFNTEIMRAFLDFGSKTPDNQHCFETIEYGNSIKTALPNTNVYGFKVKRTESVFIQSVLNILKNTPLPSRIREVYSDLTQDEWVSALVITMTVFLVFSPVKKIDTA